MNIYIYNNVLYFTYYPYYLWPLDWHWYSTSPMDMSMTNASPPALSSDAFANIEVGRENRRPWTGASNRVSRMVSQSTDSDALSTIAKASISFVAFPSLASIVSRLSRRKKLHEARSRQALIGVGAWTVLHKVLSMGHPLTHWARTLAISATRSSSGRAKVAQS